MTALPSSNLKAARVLTRKRAAFPPFYHHAAESSAAGSVQLSEAAISRPARQTELLSAESPPVLPAPLLAPPIPRGVTASPKELSWRRAE